MRRLCQHSFRVIGLVSALVLSMTVSGEDTAVPTSGIDLPVVETTERYPPYVDFCKRHPKQCKLEGASVIPHNPELMRNLGHVSHLVNNTVRFSLDTELYSVEDYWALPESGYGDCEDIALAKRARLVVLGYPSASLRLAFVFDQEELSAHCVLTVETTRGTFLLDSYSDAVLHWAESQYNFEARERTDGRWDRFDQSLWRYGSRQSASP